MEERVTTVVKTRKLADGTVKAYMSKMTYQVKNGVDDKRANNGKHAQVSAEDIEAIRKRSADGVSIKRLSDDYKICYATVKKIITGQQINTI